MKQITECLDRFFDRKRPLKKKWKAIHAMDQSGNIFLCLYHYHHLVLVYDLRHYKILFEWHETRADLRGLNSAKKYLKNFEMKSLSK